MEDNPTISQATKFSTSCSNKCLVVFNLFFLFLSDNCLSSRIVLGGFNCNLLGFKVPYFVLGANDADNRGIVLIFFNKTRSRSAGNKEVRCKLVVV